MRIAPPPDNELERLDALLRLDILDTPPEPQFDELTELASTLCQTPIALISLIDDKRQWFKSKVGLEANETSRDLAFCAHAILQDELFIVEDTLLDDRFADNPLVTGAPSIRFYAGVPLVTENGEALGTLCAIDQKPHSLSPEQRRGLTILAHQVMSQLNLRKSLRDIKQHMQDAQDAQARKNHFFRFIAHELQQPFQELLQFSNQLRLDLDLIDPTDLRTLVSQLNHSARTTFRMVDNLLQWSMLETNSMPCQPMDIPLDQLIQPIVSMFSPIARQKSVQIQIKMQLPLSLYADIDMMYALLQNLLSNAVRHTSTGGNISVEAEQLPNQTIKLSIRDNGSGISPKRLLNLFSLKPQHADENTHTGKKPHSATLGLLLCQRYASLNHGSISVESQTHTPSGTVVSVILPSSTRTKTA
jgi:signal transduction histidine kinase